MSEDDEDPKSSEASKVGYRRPPREHQFKPGESGNSKGRARTRKPIIDEIANVLTQERIYFRNGKRYKASAIVLVVEKLISEAMGGNIRALKTVLEAARHFGITKRGVNLEWESGGPDHSKEVIDKINEMAERMQSEENKAVKSTP